jgi:Zinc-binding dehydrogenase
VVFFVVETDRRLLVEIARRIDNHALRPALGRTFDLEDGARAFGAKAAGSLAGKIA